MCCSDQLCIHVHPMSILLYCCRIFFWHVLCAAASLLCCVWLFLACLGRGRFLDVSLVCIGHLRLCARQLAEGGVDVALQVRLHQTKEPAGFFGMFVLPPHPPLL